jgi:response regulator RpfG family c-di-GMP phosphodiesterase
MADEKVLLVDDNDELLKSYRRYFYQSLQVDTISNPVDAIQRLKETHYKVVMSDLKMPQMDGIRFLSIAREISPDTTRIMLTGYADVNTAINAVNEGNIFRFLTKPSPPEIVEKALRAGIEYHDLKMAERVLLEQTLNGSITLLVEILSMVNPAAFSRSSRIKKVVTMLVSRLGLTSSWHYELAATLSQIGFVTISPSLLEKIFQQSPLTDQEKQIVANHPQTAKKLLEKIPRLEIVVPMITNQHKPYDTYPPKPDGQVDVQTLGAQLLKVAVDYDTLVEAGKAADEILETMIGNKNAYNPLILEKLIELTPALPSMERRKVNVAEVESGMIVDDDIKTVDNLLLLRRGQEISEAVMLRLQTIAMYTRINEPFHVLVARKIAD